MSGRGEAAPSRRRHDVERAHPRRRHGWLDDGGRAWNDTVRIVEMDPSPCAAVREALPNARIVGEQFHLVRLSNQAVTDVRRRHVGSLRPAWPHDRHPA